MGTTKLDIHEYIHTYICTERLTHMQLYIVRYGFQKALELIKMCNFSVCRCRNVWTYCKQNWMRKCWVGNSCEVSHVCPRWEKVYKKWVLHPYFCQLLVWANLYSVNNIVKKLTVTQLLTHSWPIACFQFNYSKHHAVWWIANKLWLTVLNTAFYNKVKKISWLF